MPRRLTELPLLRRLKPGLHVHDDEALNAEPALDLLADPITPVDVFFIRNNGDVPEVEAGRDWTLTIDGEVERPTVWTTAALRDSFETVTVTAVLECAGNGRSQFSPATDGLPWRLGAVGCARWTGVRMKDVLDHAGVRDAAVYTGHYAPDRLIADPARPALSRGLPIAKALAPETLIAFAMNGEPLPRLHGGPLRIVAPGFPGSAWQKWLDRIALRACEHDGEKMRGTNYRLPLRPVLPGEPLDESRFTVITDMPVKSLITTPAHGFTVPAGGILGVSGFAWSGAVPLEGVRVSRDGGVNWQEAALEEGEGPFAWRRFSAEFAIGSAGPLVVVAQARDVEGNVQPLEIAWNPRGYCNNQAQRVSGAARAD
ncbi:sulfite oxidase [Bosea sp. 124]|uniref:sulfite oxidase n=1 Tax=Bosea sp. 124 TaxID=2135642 RepID=UPI000D41BFD6|nr:sulfite oxidase [Bosea sp. 124]PTM42014.1 DMSO/TMAO reductase YedYZ molybdopterin-dependent catalytic subunit [Bosea sp. 124]